MNLPDITRRLHDYLQESIDAQNRIIRAIQNFIEGNGGTPSGWYVGITDNADRRLFREHKVSKENGVYIYEPAMSAHVARQVEAYFVDTYKTKGDKGGGNNDSEIVYAYKIARYTDEDA